jgi:hypothetical protein
MRLRKISLGCLCGMAIVSAFIYSQSRPFRADGNKAKSYIEFLASDQLDGRQTLTPGYRKAADYVAARFKEWGLKPSGDGGTSYFQKVPIKTTVTVNVGIPALGVGNRSYSFDDADFTVNPMSTARTAVKAEVVFAGYGMSLPDKGLDEYAGLSVQGKIVLALKGSPENFAPPRGFFTETASAPSAPLGLTSLDVTDTVKIRTAFDKGAAAVLLYNPDPASASSSAIMIGGPQASAAAPLARNFLAFDITDRVFRALVVKTPQESVREYNQKLNAIRWDIRNKRPRSKATGVGVGLKGYDEIQKYTGDGLNVLGKIEGSDPVLKSQFIVIGGHLDHLGRRGTVVYNGADDDASGVATVMEVSRVLGQGGFKPKRTVVFAAWCGEEMGLLGSNHFGANPPAGIKMDQVVANFNCDMVGLGDNIGAPGALNFPEIWEKVIKRNQDPDVIAVVKPSTGGPGGSDHSTFVTKGIESLALMTGGGGGHPDYHDSGDDSVKIDPELMRKACQFVAQGTMNLADETTVNLLVPDRLYLYNALMLRVPIINTSLPGSAWRNTDFPNKSAILAKMYEREVARSAQDQAQAMQAARAAVTVMMMPTAAPAAPAPQPPVRKDLAQGVRSAAFLGDVKLLDIAANALGFGRVELSGDDGAWIVNGRLTEAGKSALKTMEANGVVAHLVNPSDDLLADVLSAAEKPLLVAGTYKLTPAAKDLVVSKKAVVSVDVDLTDVEGTVARADQAKKLVGAAANLVAFVTSTDRINDLDAKRAFYFGLIKRGWTVEEIASFVGGSLRALNPSGAAMMMMR